MEDMLFEQFLRVYEVGDDVVRASEEVLEKYGDRVPKVLLDFWREYGFGNYGGGLIKVINPAEYEDSLYEWLGKVDYSKVPILMTAFGELFYYRKLTETDDDVCLLDIHYRRVEVCTYSFEDFFDGYIVDDEVRDAVLRKELFLEAKQKLGKNSPEEIYFFEPALVLGGAEEIKYVGKGKAVVHQQLLL